MIVAFTGHRPDKFANGRLLGKVLEVKKWLRDQLVRIEPERAISGMAQGVDMWAAEICIDLGIPFIAAVPFAGQELVWPNFVQRRYHELLSKAIKVHLVSLGGYSAKKMQHRNVWMVDNSDLLLAVWDGSPGGTANCVAYAKAVGKEIIQWSPQG